MGTNLALARENLNRAVKDGRLLEDVRTVLVGFSGGSDSVLLLKLLSEIPTLSVSAAHLHHGIRGKEADRDEAFCRAFCEERGIPFFSEKQDIPTQAKADKAGVEETARRARYAFFERLANEHGFDAVATAHNADDHVETVLFHLIRGSALNGLCGIPLKRGLFIRPLLYSDKDTVLAACAEASLPFVTDSTNTDTAYTRNHIRQNLVPHMKALNPSLTDTVLSSTRLLQKERRYLDSQAAPYSFENTRTILATLDYALLARVIRRESEQEGLTVTARHVSEAIALIRSDRAHGALSLPGGTLTVDRDLVSIDREDKDPPAFELLLSYGTNVLPTGDALYLAPSDEVSEKDINKLKNVYKLSIQATLDSAKIDGKVLARTRRPGDIYRLRGITRRVKKLLQEGKRPLSIRSSLPFLTDGERLLWIPGYPPADDFAAESGLSVYYFTQMN